MSALVSTFSLSDRLNKNHLKCVKYMCIQLRNFMGAPAPCAPAPCAPILPTLLSFVWESSGNGLVGIHQNLVGIYQSRKNMRGGGASRSGSVAIVKNGPAMNKIYDGC